MRMILINDELLGLNYKRVNKLKNIEKNINNKLVKAMIKTIIAVGKDDLKEYIENIVENGVDKSDLCAMYHKEIFQEYSSDIINYAKNWEQTTGESLNWNWDIEDIVLFVYLDIAEKLLDLI